MGQKIIEGMWEEVSRRSRELAGRRVRITVLDDLTTPERVSDHLLDHDAITYCEREADDSVTLEEVRAATSIIKDSMARVVIEEERAERF